MPTASGRPMLIADEAVPSLAAGLVEVVRTLGLSDPRELHQFARRFKVLLPSRHRKGGK